MSQESGRYAADKEHTYVALNAPNFKTRLTINGEHHLIAFKDGTLKLSGKVAEAFDAVLHAKGSAVGRVVRKVDKDLGERMARAHLAENAARAAKGPFSSNQRMEMLKHTLDARKVDMSRVTDQKSADKFAQELAGGDMALQEVADPSQLAKVVAEANAQHDAKLSALEDSIPAGQPAVNVAESEAAEKSVATESVPFKLNK